MIKEYTKKDGSKAYLFVAYLGVDPVTGKQKRTTRRGFKTKREAKLAEAQLQNTIQTNGFTKSKKYTFEEVYHLWLSQYKVKVKESTLNRVMNNFSSAILPHFKDTDIKKITTPYCQNVLENWIKNYKIASSLLQLTNEVFDYAVNLDILLKNPLKLVSKPRVEDDVKDDSLLYYTKDELQTFLNYCKEHDDMTYCMFRVLAFSGMRKGELYALTWSDIDFNNQTISINKTLSNGINGKLIIQSPKTKNSYRTIRLDDTTMSILSTWKQQQYEQLMLFGHKILANQLVFSTPKKNTFLFMHFLNNKIDTICKKKNFKKISVHGFRHTHCSLLLASGVPIQDVQERLGHTDIKTTLSIYTHITQEQKEKAVDTLMNYIDF